VMCPSRHSEAKQNNTRHQDSENSSFHTSLRSSKTIVVIAVKRVLFLLRA
jgi:hypothetical protein